MLKLLFAVLFISVSATAFAQESDSVLKKYRMTIISAKEYSTLIKNNFEGMAAVADTNKYPSAQKALTYRKEIDLSPKQLADLRQVDEALSSKKQEMAKFLRGNEKTLDSLFRTNKLNEGIIIYYTNRFGLYQGELRNAILQAAYKTHNLLSPGQIAKLNKLKKS